MIAHPRPRKTLSARATLEGKGLFTGQPCKLTFAPAQSGLRFLRTDIAAPIPVHFSRIDHAPIHPAFGTLKARSTNLMCCHGLAATVEHALSALNGLGVTDCTIEIDAPELPILDGSARPFVDAILQAGLTDVPGAIEPLTLETPIIVAEHTNKLFNITATPREEPGWSITYELDYGPAADIPTQSFTWDGSADTYAKTIASARTFCTELEANNFTRNGLFKDLSPADMLVIGKNGPIDNAYRMDNEPAAHKLLDAIGDFALAGRPIQADITCHRTGHALNHRFAQMVSRSLPITMSARP